MTNGIDTALEPIVGFVVLDQGAVLGGGDLVGMVRPQRRHRDASGELVSGPARHPDHVLVLADAQPEVHKYSRCRQPCSTS
jgi:hypothetical protein